MASLLEDERRGRKDYRLQFYDHHRKRRSIWLGDVKERKANDIKGHVEELVTAAKLGTSPKPATTAWLGGLDGRLRERLESVGLIDSQPIRSLPRTVIAYMRAYIVGRTDWAKPANYKQAVDKLESFLGRDVKFASLTKGEAERFHRWLTQRDGLSPHTAGQAIKRCRQMVKAAIDDGVAETNPFAGIKIDLSSDSTKNRFIDHDTAVALLNACPDQEWRVLFALCRWGGLRNPSETLRLRWSDINWERDRFKVHASKTARYGKGERVVPLFPELRAELDAWFEIAEPGVECAADAFVIQTYRDTEANLRKAIHRIADVAGVPQWPKPFMALRASRRTELEESGKYANHVLNAWLGHSKEVAERHYLMVTEDNFTKACRAVCRAIQDDQETSTAENSPKKSKKTADLVAIGSSSQPNQYTPEDSNL